MVVTLSSALHAKPFDSDTAKFQIIRTGYGLSMHKEMFMLPVTISEEYDGAQTEAVFQVSAKHRLFGSRFYFAYKQISFWQAYDHDNSAPFRETNYNPEIFYRTKTTEFQKGIVGADLGLEHESNGQVVGPSRSWNLLYACPYYYRNNLLIYLKLRYRIPEDEKESPNSPVGDDNPDITDYYGHNDLHIYYEIPNRHSVHLLLRGNLSTGMGAMNLMYTIPVPHSESSHFAIRLSHGYGESMVDYKKSLTRIGFGFMFKR
jgi:phospholipase A1